MERVIEIPDQDEQCSISQMQLMPKPDGPKTDGPKPERPKKSGPKNSLILDLADEIIPLIDSFYKQPFSVKVALGLQSIKKKIIRAHESLIELRQKILVDSGAEENSGVYSIRPSDPGFKIYLDKMVELRDLPLDIDVPAEKLKIPMSVSLANGNAHNVTINPAILDVLDLFVEFESK